MDYNALKQRWLVEENREFKGWDFSYLDGRLEEEKLPWDYKTKNIINYQTVKTLFNCDKVFYVFSKYFYQLLI